MKIADTIKNLRIESGKTQEQIAAECGIKQGVYTNWETGKYIPSAENLIKLADCFECTVDYLLSRENDVSVVTIEKKEILSPEENFLVESYRRCNRRQREAVQNFVRGLLAV